MESFIQHARLGALLYYYMEDIVDGRCGNLTNRDQFHSARRQNLSEGCHTVLTIRILLMPTSDTPVPQFKKASDSDSFLIGIGMGSNGL